MPQRACYFLCVLLVAGSVSGQEGAAEVNHSYAKISRIFARHCLECHGPDANHREAGLRLDDRQIATERLESGNFAVMPGMPEDSELLRRVTALDDTRMPPAEAVAPLTAAEIAQITEWIRAGAEWDRHWALVAPVDHPLPDVRDDAWASQPLDRFILRRMEDNLQQPRAVADRRTLIRRIYFDLIGLPPTLAQVERFQNDESPDAWGKVIDELLATPMYGQRWGRHWLDVARYGDSNGSDENKAYPLAWRYRNYVIDAFNDDLSFDRFLREQLAGDLLPDDAREHKRVIATGFLAIGTKILAEKDPVKKQADMVDEQIDTVGKALLGFTVACARCHDHKFDPIPTSDYYALAGILHSTMLEDRVIETQEYLDAKAVFDRNSVALADERRRLEAKLSKTPAGLIDRQAEDFQRGNVVDLDTGYGEGIGVTGDPGAQKNFVEWDFELAAAGEYFVQLRYAAQDARPGPLLINGVVAKPDAVSQTTGGWMPADQLWFTEGRFLLSAGANVIRIESEPCMSHIDRVRLILADGGDSDLNETVNQLTALEQQQSTLQQQAPQPPQAMAVTDGQPQNVKVHLRGSHLALGDEVLRGFPRIAAAATHDESSADSPFRIGEAQSGRLQLAQWMTDTESGAGRHVARVFVNRVWHWHFGRGLVATPSEFGLQGQPPTHPQLLDWLTMRFIEDGWSVKSLHRRILMSATWRQQSVSAPNDWFVGYSRRRMEAEVIRDTLLFHSGQLDLTSADGLEGVKSENPSPEDLRQNEEFHRSSRKRSVYLPVVRSNTYRFFSLFDFPNATTSVGQRDVTTVPTQALLLLNDPFVMDQAQHLAAALLVQTTDETRLAEVYRRLFSRLPTPEEQRAADDFLRAFASTTAGSESAELDAWSALCHGLIASSEFIYVE